MNLSRSGTRTNRKYIIAHHEGLLSVTILLVEFNQSGVLCVFCPEIIQKLLCGLFSLVLLLNKFDFWLHDGEWCHWLCDSHGCLFQLKMSGKLPLVLVASLALVSVVAAHSVEKRQTTVSKSEPHVSCNNDDLIISVWFQMSSPEVRWEGVNFHIFFSIDDYFLDTSLVTDDYWLRFCLYKQRFEWLWFLFVLHFYLICILKTCVNLRCLKSYKI